VSASAEKWSAEGCRHLQEMKADVYDGDKDFLVYKLIPILRFQREKCGVDWIRKAAGPPSPQNAGSRRDHTNASRLIDQKSFSFS
jgi:hypothetical protein